MTFVYPEIFLKKPAPWRSGVMSMMSYSRDLFQIISNTLQKLEEALHKAVPAISQKQMMPRWRNLGQPITPYHYMRPALIPVVKQTRNNA